MGRNRKTTIFGVGIIFLVFVICGFLGYINTAGRFSPATTTEPAPTETPSFLGYCSSLSSLCIVSFGYDSANNTLIILRSSHSGLSELYIVVKQDKSREIYTCQIVQFAPDIYYCLGHQIPDQTMITIEIYSKASDRLLAIGTLRVNLKATPTAINLRASPLPTVLATKQPTVTKQAGTTVNINTVTPAYPYSYP